MSQRQIELSYERGRPPWYLKRRVQRWGMRLVAFVAILWFLQLLPPMWSRYRCYRLEQQAISYPKLGQSIVAHYSATQPFVHVPSSADSFCADFWGARKDCNLFSVRNVTPAGGSGTLIFCGSLSASTGESRIVQVFATSGTIWGGHAAVLSILFCQKHSLPWVILTAFEPKAYEQYGSDCGSEDIQLSLDADDDLTIFGGDVNRGDPSEADIYCTVNGRPETLRLHLAKYSPPHRWFGIAVDTRIRPLLGLSRGWGGTNIVDWPLLAM